MVPSDVLPPFKERIVEAVWKEADLYRVWRLFGSPECDAVDFSLFSLAAESGRDVGGQWVCGGRVCISANSCRCAAAPTSGVADAALYRFGRWRPGGEGSGRWDLENDSIAPCFPLQPHVGKMDCRSHFLDSAGADVGHYSRGICATLVSVAKHGGGLASVGDFQPGRSANGLRFVRVFTCFHGAKRMHGRESCLHVLLLQYETRGGNHPGAFICNLQPRHGNDSIHGALSRILIALSFPDMALHVRLACSLGTDRSVSQYFSSF